MCFIKEIAEGEVEELFDRHRVMEFQNPAY